MLKDTIPNSANNNPDLLLIPQTSFALLAVAVVYLCPWPHRRSNLEEEEGKKGKEGEK
jgi:hypothetical protein